MAKYNRALDYLTLAFQRTLSGDAVNAAKCLAFAAKQPDAVQALATLENTGRVTIKAAVKEALAAKKLSASKVASKKRVTAADEEFDESVFEDDDDEDEDEEGEDEEEEEHEEARVRASAKRRVKAKRKVRATREEEDEEEEEEEEDDDKEVNAAINRILSSMHKRKTKRK